MGKRDYIDKCMEIADQILDLSADLKRYMLMNQREVQAESARARFRLTASGSTEGTSEGAQDDLDGVVVGDEE